MNSIFGGVCYSVLIDLEHLFPPSQLLALQFQSAFRLNQLMFSPSNANLNQCQHLAPKSTYRILNCKLFLDCCFGLSLFLFYLSFMCFLVLWPVLPSKLIVTQATYNHRLAMLICLTDLLKCYGFALRLLHLKFLNYIFNSKLSSNQSLLIMYTNFKS